jgi:hypothetical protein
MSEGHFEAKKHAYRQTQDGIVISFVMHPNDVAAALATAPLGTRYMVAFVEMGDDGKPVSVAQERKSLGKPRDAGSTPAGDAKPKRAWEQLTAAEQSGIRCNEQPFCDFLRTQFPVRWGKAYHGDAVYSSEIAAVVVREYCGVASRSKLDKEPAALERWRDLEARYQAWTLEQRYPEQVRG